MDRTYEQTMSDLRMMLRDQPPYTTADLTECAVVYLDTNGALHGVFLSADEPEGLDEPFAVDAWFIGQIDENVKDWFANPRFSHRPLLRDWELDAPPLESTVD
ncbi:MULTISPECIES: hypothetical protein [unclassified Caballeronia]|uniref:hypothetical protein n=1 Tax=unclassified Caballeronia TaxID=2646786 RepID=UPI0028568A3A|nr:MULTISPECIES: hypothetical protein [unclassified Caballeronia]MDR5776979.1 hypothetical protein [Caballeronia sp. LZ002]MDR5852446.1 hypothetical protein [Caballeronia sp. LZ003]